MGPPLLKMSVDQKTQIVPVSGMSQRLSMGVTVPPLPSRWFLSHELVRAWLLKLEYAVGHVEAGPTLRQPSRDPEVLGLFLPQSQWDAVFSSSS